MKPTITGVAFRAIAIVAMGAIGAQSYGAPSTMHAKKPAHKHHAMAVKKNVQVSSGAPMPKPGLDAKSEHDAMMARQTAYWRAHPHGNHVTAKPK